MRQRTSIDREQQTVFLRRSPRFLPKSQQDSDDPKTPDLERRIVRVIHTDFSPLSSNHKISVNKKPREVSRKAKKKANASTLSTNSIARSRRSSRLKGKGECLTEVSKTNVSLISSISSTGCRRSSRLNMQNRVAENGSIQKPYTANVKKKVSQGLIQASCFEKANTVVNSSNNSLVKLEKRPTRSSCQSPGNEGRAKQGGRIDKSSTSKLKNIQTCIPKPSEVAAEGTMELGEKKRDVKRKTAQEEDVHVISKGWTNEQELALQKAYFAAKATPHFWKKVSKMVPGKSAQECFDRVHLDHLTPPHPRPRSRAKKAESSLSSPSTSILLQTAETNVKKMRCSKVKSHFSQKAVREMLDKQSKTDGDKEADLFSVLEATTDHSSGVFQQAAANFVTPEVKLERLSFLGRCRERSSSAHKELHQSRLSNLSGTTLFSPPVLKPIKNKALHDRYIDQLHCREAKRKAVSLRTSKHTRNINDGEGDKDQSVNTIQAAKNALIFDARDAISQFQNLQANSSNFFSDGEEEDDDCGYDDDSVEL